jgi:hypothetical protein
VDRLTRLTDTRDRLAEAIAGCDSNRDLAALSREYRQVLAELDAVQPVKEVDLADELNKRRAAKRKSVAKGSGRAAGGV